MLVLVPCFQYSKSRLPRFNHAVPRLHKLELRYATFEPRSVTFYNLAKCSGPKRNTVTVKITSYINILCNCVWTCQSFYPGALDNSEGEIIMDKDKGTFNYWPAGICCAHVLNIF